MNIGSSEVLGIVLSMFNSALLISYAISIVVFLIRRLQGHLTQHARFSLGKWGTIINVLALAWIAPFIVFSFFPIAPKPTPATMNWDIVMVGGTLIWATGYYAIWGRKTYTPPTKSIQDIIEIEHSEEAPSEKEQAVSESEVVAVEKAALPSELGELGTE
jgi:choline transport protein